MQAVKHYVFQDYGFRLQHPPPPYIPPPMGHRDPTTYSEYDTGCIVNAKISTLKASGFPMVIFLNLYQNHTPCARFS